MDQSKGMQSIGTGTRCSHDLTFESCCSRIIVPDADPQTCTNHHNTAAASHPWILMPGTRRTACSHRFEGVRDIFDLLVTRAEDRSRATSIPLNNRRHAIHHLSRPSLTLLSHLRLSTSHLLQGHLLSLCKKDLVCPGSWPSVMAILSRQHLSCMLESWIDRRIKGHMPL